MPADPPYLPSDAHRYTNTCIVSLTRFFFFFESLSQFFSETHTHTHTATQDPTPQLDNQTAPLTLSFSGIWSLHPDMGRPFLFTPET